VKTTLAVLFPARADNFLPGGRLPVWLFTLIACVSFVRSCIHMFAPDGGAGSIAGMNLAVPGADGIIFAFALWGSSQLIYALIQLLVAFRYRSLIPLMYLLLAIEALLRILVGRMKPVTFSHMPPGAYGNYLMIPLAIAMLAMILMSRENPGRAAPGESRSAEA
jgi:hypothetical protein